MPRIKYQEFNFGARSLETIRQAQEIVAVYAAQGYDLTLRQLYYQFVSRDLIANKQTEYKRLGSIINDARLAGLIDWEHITDRTREYEENGHWETPQDILDAVAQQFRYDTWADQPYRVEVWVEKEALAGVFERVCKELDIGWFSCRGYTSQSEMWVAAQRLAKYRRRDQKPVILHFGDHDPSGLDMTRDIEDRLSMFLGGRSRFEMRRLALNMDQIEEYAPPPNPAKVTDSRYTKYEDEYGDESWELDALEPAILANMVREEVATLREDDRYLAAQARQSEARGLLTALSESWDDTTEWLKDNGYYTEPEEEGEDDE